VNLCHFLVSHASFDWILSTVETARHGQPLGGGRLAIGVNDMKFRDNHQIVENYRRILQVLPEKVSVVCSAVLPVNEDIYSNPSIVNNTRITDLNASLKVLCPTDLRCIFVDARRRLIDANGNLSAAFQDGDGIHLNAVGNHIWIEELRDGLSKAQQGGSGTVSAGSVKHTKKSP